MKMKKTWMALTMAGLLMGTTSGGTLLSKIGAASAASEAAFTDVKPSAWYYASVAKLAGKGLVNGCGDGLFCPDRSITRAEFIKMTDSALGLPVGEAAAGQAWHVPYIQAAVSAGVHKTSDFNDNWSQPISRQEMARLVVRAVDEKLRQAKTTDPQLVYEATKRGILSGLSGGELGLKESSTRAQATVIIDRMLTLLAGGTLPMDKRAASYAEVAYTGTNVETMWGGKFRQLPFKANIRPYIDGEFKQIIIIDMDDKNSPYMNWVPKSSFEPVNKLDPAGIHRLTYKPWKDEYLVAFKVNVTNTKTEKLSMPFMSMISLPHFIFALHMPYGSKGPLGSNWHFDMRTIHSQEIWALYSISKEKVKEASTYNNVFFYFESFGNDKHKILLNEEGRIFGGKIQ
ncbi:S-layer homology domain-containing protein [Paenibacillus pasadenensis]|uniref:S-layer domain protein n=1 Tax=Paenibacillus pasadenensis TaxID=217090 RepID=A0A2N5N539_9BACL|nr:S-layer homology domain-containing protein [Paenibacillus pasadenensis]PLT45474.1 S-layer domain protein [Paenibacillus pasadenensis]